MKLLKKITAAAVSAVLLCTVAAVPCTYAKTTDTTSTASSDASSYEWGALNIGGGGFVSGIVTGQEVMYARTDVGGAYKYNYDTDSWEQLLDFLTEDERGLLSVDAICIDPTDDNKVYMLCGCAYFSDAATVIFRTEDGGETWERTDVTDLIQVHGNGDGRQCGEAIAVDPDDPDTLYCGGDVAAGSSCLIKSTDGGVTWESVDGYADLNYYTATINWPTWESHTVAALSEGAYNTQNGVSSVLIEDGKVYVATSVSGKANVHVADVGEDVFTVLSEDLPTGYYPSRISNDGQGNLFITYIAGLAFDGSSGGAYKYDTATGTVTDISPLLEGSAKGMGAIYADPTNPDHLVATTCGLWYTQLWSEWTAEHGAVWGDCFFKSEDGGETWVKMNPGNSLGYGLDLEAEYLQDGGRSWIQYKAIHWVGSIVIDPRDTDRIFVTSGNGIFACDNTWDTKPQFYFHPDGIEEVVALDLVSVPGGDVYSAIGDYDGFIHTSVDEVGEQYQPNMGSTSAIAYCPSNPDVMVRIAENQSDGGSGYYSLDGGKTWTSMSIATGGKAAITELSDGTYRIFCSNGGSLSYSDDFGGTWNDTNISGVYRSCVLYPSVDPDDPSKVYAYGYSKPENQWDNTANVYKLYVSTDYGATFSDGIEIATYDYCDAATRIAFLGSDDLILAAGWYGLYHVTDSGTTIEKKDVYYCKTVGYGAPEEEGGLNTLYIYGKPTANDVEGIYRSTDGGDTWVCINTDHLYGGTGNGNFLVGDMNTFGTVYMSTVGCGIVYGRLTDSAETPTETTEPTESTVLYGDANVDGSVNILDVIVLNRSLLGSGTLEAQGAINADVDLDGAPSAADSLNIMRYVVKLITALPV
jgi:hypothetical protein